jgi:hypothetical protein
MLTSVWCDKMKTRLAYYKCRNPQTNTQLNLNLLHQIERLPSSSSRSLSTLLAVGEHVPIPQQPQVSEITSNWHKHSFFTLPPSISVMAFPAYCYHAGTLIFLAASLAALISNCKNTSQLR